MKQKLLLITSLLAFAGLAMAATPSISISNPTSTNAVVINLNIRNANKIKDVSFKGLDDFSLISRSIEFNDTSSKSNNPSLTASLSLIPTKAESVVVHATANLDNKKYTSNMIKLIVTQAQVDNYKAIQKKQLDAQQKQMQKYQAMMDKQFEEQQRLFESINAMMIKQQTEMFKTMQEMDKAFSF